jgi:hypothetical protein
MFETNMGMFLKNEAMYENLKGMFGFGKGIF